MTGCYRITKILGCVPLKKSLVYGLTISCVLFLSLQLFGGNSDASSERTHYLSVPLTARYVRLHPIKWHGNIAMRASLIGCPRIAGECFFSVNISCLTVNLLLASPHHIMSHLYSSSSWIYLSVCFRDGLLSYIHV